MYAHTQVRKARIQPMEEIALRKAVRAMESRKAAAEQCAAVRAAIVGEGSGGGGVVSAVRSLETQLKAIMAKEEQLGESACYSSRIIR